MRREFSPVLTYTIIAPPESRSSAADRSNRDLGMGVTGGVGPLPPPPREDQVAESQPQAEPEPTLPLMPTQPPQQHHSQEEEELTPLTASVVHKPRRPSCRTFTSVLHNTAVDAPPPPERSATDVGDLDEDIIKSGGRVALRLSSYHRATPFTVGDACGTPATTCLVHTPHRPTTAPEGSTPPSFVVPPMTPESSRFPPLTPERPHPRRNSTSVLRSATSDSGSDAPHQRSSNNPMSSSGDRNDSSALSSAQRRGGLRSITALSTLSINLASGILSPLADGEISCGTHRPVSPRSQVTFYPYAIVLDKNATSRPITPKGPVPSLVLSPFDAPTPHPPPSTLRRGHPSDLVQLERALSDSLDCDAGSIVLRNDATVLTSGADGSDAFHPDGTANNNDNDDTATTALCRLPEGCRLIPLLDGSIPYGLQRL